SRVEGASVSDAAAEGASSRFRAILMTSFAMIAGMAPMAIGLGEGGSQTAPLGRAVIGGLLGATLATLGILPAIFALLQREKTRKSASIHPDDHANQNGEHHVGESMASDLRCVADLRVGSPR